MPDWALSNDAPDWICPRCGEEATGSYLDHVSSESGYRCVPCAKNDNEWGPA